MSENIKLLLSDEFIAFSQKIKGIVEKKKEKEKELKQLYDQIKLDLKTLDDEAAAAQQEWEEFKTSKEDASVVVDKPKKK